MEQRYKDALRQIYRDKLISDQKPSSYAQELFRSSNSYFMRPLRVDVQPEVKEGTEVKSVTEKTLILDSLHQFGKEKLEENENKPIQVEGGEIRAKDTGTDGFTHEFELSPVNKDQLSRYTTDRTSQVIQDLRYSLDKVEQNKLKVIFVSDSFNNSDLEEVSEDIKEFYSLFEKDTAVLFSRMTKAMKLENNDFLLSAIKYADQEVLEMVLNEIYAYKPDLVITLGVSASHALLNIKKRLKDIHGKFHKIKVNDYALEVMPLFSPNLLNTAVHMKKMAWEDMQKAMEHLAL